MVSYLVFPKGYDPMVSLKEDASWQVKPGIHRTVSPEVERQRILSKLVRTTSTPPEEGWYQEVSEPSV